ncbi:MAG: hypothetical protein RLZZ141_1890 [Pseudomonadota bacterium]
MLDQVNGVGDLGVGDVVLDQIGGHGGCHVLDVAWGFVSQTDEQQARDRTQVNRLQASAALVEILAHMVGKDQVAFERVGPGMIAADQIADLLMRAIDEARAAVTADIMEGADLQVVIAHDQDRGLADVDHEHVAWLRHIGLNADIDPVAAKDQIHIGLEYIGTGIEVGFQTVADLTAGDQLGEGGGFVGLRHGFAPLDAGN